jgi:hypothetical protein
VRFRFTPINSLILQYWNLSLNGTALTGRLADDHTGEAAAFSLLGVRFFDGVTCTLPTQLAIAEGTTLTGTVTQQSITLRIVGNTNDTFHAFTAEITATRSG